MAAQSYAIEFVGYWREPNKGSIPTESGIYCVLSCVHNVAEKKVSPKKLIYIGESEDVNARIANHDKLQDWQEHLNEGEVLCYSFGPVPSANRVRCEAAMIFKHKPPVNIEYAEAFPFDKTILTLTGKVILLQTNSTVSRT
jgi:hypothetical protein